MKEAEFIELLNLYLDHEISAADAARLEAEVQQNAARRQVYRQYCQMQKACTLLAKDFADQPAPAVESEKIAKFPGRRAAWAPVAWSAAGLAAAACLAFVFVDRSGNVAPSSAPVDQPLVAQVTPPVVDPPAPAPANDGTEPRLIARTIAAPAARHNDLQAVFTASALAVASTDTPPPVQFAWIGDVQLRPIAPAPEELQFDSRATIKQDPAVFRSRHPFQGKVEMSAFQLQTK